MKRLRFSLWKPSKIPILDILVSGGFVVGLLELLLIPVGLSMDAFAVSLCKGLRMRSMQYRQTFLISLTFGLYQAIMPLLGWTLAMQFRKYIMAIDHWIAFLLLMGIGIKMLWDAYHEDLSCPLETNQGLDFVELNLLGIATSIDALAIGISFAFLSVPIWEAITIVGIVTFALSFVAVFIGNRFGTRFQRKATVAGGCILMGIGTKILLSHLGIIGF